MLGAIAGDMIGAPYEFDSNNIKTTDFPLFLGKKRSKFTDDSVLTVATAEAILTGGDYAGAYVKYFNLYPHAGYGTSFRLACRSVTHALRQLRQRVGDAGIARRLVCGDSGAGAG